MEISSNTEMNGQEILEMYIESGLHAVGNTRIQWKDSAMCVSIMTLVGGAKTLLIHKSSAKHHAEHGVITFVEENMKKISSVKILSKYSPCSNSGVHCCTKIREIKEKLMNGDGKEINFELVFAALYKINRPSCLKRGCFKGNVGGHYPTEENGGNFKNLVSLGSSIRSFETGDWAELIELLALWDASRGVAGAGLAATRFGDKYGHWRDFEDAELKRDFEILKHRLQGVTRVTESSLRNIEKEVSKIKEALAKLH